MIPETRRIKSSIRHRLLFWVWLTSSIATFVFTGGQLFREYSLAQNEAINQVNLIRLNHLPSIEKSVWDYDYDHLNLQLQGISNLPNVKYASIEPSGGEKLVISRSIYDLKMVTIDLNYQKTPIGKMTIGIDLKSIQDDYLGKALLYLLIQGFKTLIVCWLLLKIFEHLIMKNVSEIVKYLKQFDLNDGKTLKLNRDENIDDEFSLIQESLNDLKTGLSQTTIELKKLNTELESKVDERTKLLDLERARSINASKLASLGEMAGGIAHEINNPLAIISTSMKYLKKLIEKGQMNEEHVLEAIGYVDNTVIRISKIIT